MKTECLGADQTRVLVVEKNEHHAALILDAVGTSFVVEHVDRLQDALEHPALNDFDVVLCGLTPKDVSGVDTVRRIRRRADRLPLIILTCIQDEDAALEVIQAGAQDYLVKTETLQTADFAAMTIRRAIRYAVQRQATVCEVRKLVGDLRESHSLLEQKNQRLRDLYNTSQRFVDNVSHEFRTPLTVIKEYASLVRDGIVGEINDEQKKMLNVIEDRSDDLNTMVDDLLDVSKLEVGLLGVLRIANRLDKIVDHIMPSLVRKAAVRNVCFEVSTPADLPDVWCDEEKVGRTIINLVVNAIKFCGQPGMVRMWAEAHDEAREVVVFVRDNGPGIPEDKLNLIFERFQQPVAAARQSTKGFGLGLGIAKELVDLNFGSLSVSTEEGQGSTFVFTIPYAEPREVLRRQLARLYKMSDGDAALCLAVLEADGARDQKDLYDFQLFLRHGFRAYDQLFDVSANRWVAALAVPPLDVEMFFDRLRSERRELSRNRPRGPLPEIRVVECQSWRFAPDQEQLVLSEFGAMMATEVCNV